MKEVFKSTVIYFLIGATVTGSVYHLITYDSIEELQKALVYNLILIVIAFLFSFIGYKSKKKNP
jgi:hypothetical protein